MKKTIILISALLVASAYSGAAQTDSTRTTKDLLSEIEQMADQIEEKKSSSSSNKGFQFDLLNHFGMTLNKIDAFFTVDKFGPSREWYLNVADAKLGMGDYFYLSLGLDLKWTQVRSSPEWYLSLDTHNVGRLEITPYDQVSGAPMKNSNCKVTVLSYTVPLTLAFNVRHFTLRAGCEFNYNRPGTVKSISGMFDPYDSEGIYISKGATTEKFTYDYIASFSIGPIGILYKHYNQRLLPDYSTRHGERYREDYDCLGFVVTF